MKNLKNVLLYLGIPIVLIITIAAVMFGSGKTEEKKYSDIIEMLYNYEISEIDLNQYSGELIYTTRADGVRHRYNVANVSIFYSDVSE